MLATMYSVPRSNPSSDVSSGGPNLQAGGGFHGSIFFLKENQQILINIRKIEILTLYEILTLKSLYTYTIDYKKYYY